MARGKGENTYYKDNRGFWRGQIDLGKDINGKRIRKSATGKTKAEVQKKLDQIKQLNENGTVIDKNDITISQMLHIIIDQDYKLNILNKSSYMRKLETAALIERNPIANMKIQKVTENDLQEYFLTITNYSNSLIRKDYELIKRLFNECQRRKIVVENPMQYVMMPKSNKQTRKIRALTTEEQNKLVEYIETNPQNYNGVDYSNQIMLMLATGMRMGEINALDINDINFQFNVITVRRTISKGLENEAVIGATTKTYAGMRKIPITPRTKAILNRCIDNYIPNKENLLFWDYRANKPISTQMVNNYFKRVLNKGKILDDTQDGDITLHSLRHTYATRCIEGGMTAKILQNLLGHADISTTLNTYCDIFDQFRTSEMEQVETYLKSIGL